MATNLKNTSNLSCRIDSSVYEILVKDAHSKGLSLNSLIGIITKRYASWGKNLEEIGIIPITKEAVKLIFENLDDKDIEKIGSYVGSTIPRDFIMITYGTINFPNIISTLEIWGSQYGHLIHDIENQVHNIKVYHRLNRKFSLYLSCLLEAMSKDLSFNLKIISQNASLITIEISENNFHSKESKY